MAKKKNQKIRKLHKPLNINVGVIIFGIIFVYLAFSVTAYLSKEKIQFYEVVQGGIVRDRSYTGLILRQEQVKNSAGAGYINLYLREGKRASVGARIYSLDETGGLKALMDEIQTEEQPISKENIRDLRKQMDSFVISFQDSDFSTVYDYRYDLENSVMEYASFGTVEQLDQMAAEAGVNFQQITSDVSGVVSYGIDSYEGLTPSDVEEALFDRSGYSKTIRQSGQMIDSGVPVYKIVTSEDWSIVFLLSEEDQEHFSDRSALTIHFLADSFTTTANYSTITGKDGKTYGKLDFSKYMEQFIGDRFVEFEIVEDQTRGLKIPISAVTEKDFYLVPMEYMTPGGDSSDQGFYKEVYSEEGTSVVFVPADIYYSDETYYYVDAGEGSELKSGDYIVKPQSTDRFQLSQTASLKGVYNINRGYAVFKQIEILDSNEEYYTVKEGTSYGLSVYDHIVLNASMVQEGQILYQ